MGRRSALITGLAGTELNDAEAQFLKSCRPVGIILFQRNCQSVEQIRRLIGAARSAIGDDDVLVLIDQEGGRVQRLKPPIVQDLPPAAAFGRCYADMGKEEGCAAAYAAARLVASQLASLGINTNCTPVLDIPVPGAHDIIGDRAYGATVEQVVQLGRAVIDGHLASGVVPVMKHIPGHGRAREDSHLSLPVVTTDRATLEATDFAPFAALAGCPAAMTAHVVYTAIDPHAPASTSPAVIGDVIRGAIGFDGLLMSDDLSMSALTGSLRARAEAVIAAGCDVALHCNGVMAEMEAAAAGVPDLAAHAQKRAMAAFQTIAPGAPFDVAAAESRLAQVFAGHT